VDTTVDSDIQQPEVPGKRPRRLLVRLATVVLVLLLVAGIAIHTSFVRGRALSSAASWLSSHFDILLRADSLDYNLLTLRCNLTNLSLANRRTKNSARSGMSSLRSRSGGTSTETTFSR